MRQGTINPMATAQFARMYTSSRTSAYKSHSTAHPRLKHTFNNAKQNRVASRSSDDEYL